MLSLSETERILKVTPLAIGIPTADQWPSREKLGTLGIDTDGIAKGAGALLEQPLDVPRFSQYRHFADTGSRTEIDRAVLGFTSTISTLALAELMTDDGRFLSELEDRIFAACDLCSWVMASHSGESGLPDARWLASPGEACPRGPDLHACSFAAELGLIDLILDDRLHPHLRDRIRYEVDRRVLAPVEKHSYHWHHGTNNWNGVCTGGVVTAALTLLSDARRQARLIAQSAASFRTFLDVGFENDGACTEGIGYWGYGISRFTFASELLRRRTGGAIDSLAHDKMPEIAAFPIRCEIADGLYPPFSDANPNQTPPAWTLALLGRRFALPELCEMSERYLKKRPARNLMPACAMAFLVPNYSAPPTPACKRRPRSMLLPEAEWLLSRPDEDDTDGLILAAKGGHNAEPHNHNDVGAFTVFLHSRMRLLDPGKPVYDRAYFSSKRYDNPLADSCSHCVPVVNGCGQDAGRKAAATILENTFSEQQDRLTLDLTAAYPPQAGHERLTRTFVYERGDQPSVTVEDTIRFTNDGQTWASRLVALEPFTVEETTVRVAGLQIDIETEHADLRIDRKHAAHLVA